jgi:hypothetical protein
VPLFIWVDSPDGWESRRGFVNEGVDSDRFHFRCRGAELACLASTDFRGRACTDLNSVCYNSFTEHGQMLGVADACGGFWAVWRTVHLLSIWPREEVLFGERVEAGETMDSKNGQ